ncbi:magnesium transporter [Photobacterium aphoticum]|uniref:Magnesium transporter MgtE n=1 Tax=Photobacterium aphoticum TaxID=754436 RepID=A0A090QRB6_9GAMM|nr:magnesium transporter [Photobacterium aphoticum]KLU99109.1 magnesium transporter MgtE [Photobacterium aphoticum]PSU59102.1 magnesium transporter [Photobacterium aphoticum]GAL04369.1 Mg/Co/Ni transporter MgtE / CBS domain [Photobacterium aphoticum]GHA45562.1 magnesium transporter MgtE [Photobacterium aphoticum]
MIHTLDLSLLIERISAADTEEQRLIFNEPEIQQLEAGSLATLFEALPLDQRMELWRQLPLNDHVDVLTAMRADTREWVIQSLTSVELDLVLAKLDNLSLIEWADSLPEEIIDRAIDMLSKEDLELFDRANQYTDEQIGRYANPKVISLPQGISVKRARVLLERYGYHYPAPIYVVTRSKKFVGAINYQQLMEAETTEKLSALADTECPVLEDDTSLTEAVEAIEHSERFSLPIVDENYAIVGDIDLHLALELMRENYESTLMANAGMSEEDDLFAPIAKSARKRAIWLGINLVTAVLAAMTISLFEDVIAEVVALAILMPIVASMGGIAGSQTLTLMIRGMALNQVTAGNRMSLLRNECGIGFLNGVLWAVLIGIMAGLWFQSPVLGIVIAVGIVINIITAALFGVLIPVALDKLELDPALAGSVVLTTVTDVVGFFAFLGTAKLLLL